ncbi:MAG: sensor histidine kinase [Chloroflexi bacterium]|nr:sensor histidine kinase [Chloroflexota bacterium]
MTAWWHEWRRWTIRRELALLVLATLLPFAALGAYWAREDYRSEQARIQARALRLAREVSAEVDQFISDTGALVEALARVPSVKRSERPEANNLLNELAERYSYYEALFVVDAEGRVVATGGEDVDPPGNRLTYTRQTLRLGSTYVTDTIPPRGSGRHVFVVATPLWDPAGEPIGIVGASVNLLRLQEGIRRADLPENSSVLIVDRVGRIVARRTDPEHWVGRSAYDSSGVRSALRMREGISEGDFVDGARKLSGFAPVQRVQWEVIVGIPTDEAYGALRRELWRALGRLAVVALIAGASAWLLSRRLTRPIGDLAAGAGAYTAGDLSYRINTRGPEELTTLATTLNQMAAALQQKVEELQLAQQREREAGERALDEVRRLHSEFVAVAAHELRTPVAAAKSYAELLLRDETVLSPAIRRQALTRLDAVCERLARLVRSLLGASRIQAGRLEVRREPVDICSLVARVAEEFSTYAAGHEVIVSIPDGFNALAIGDAERIEDVLVNLLSNAVKYSPEGATIQVRLFANEADDVEVEVVDQGPGVPREEQGAVFERFRRGHGIAASGVGLGLYISRAYVQAMGGEIGVRSTPGQGATFWIRLAGTTPDVPLTELYELELLANAPDAEPNGLAAHTGTTNHTDGTRGTKHTD